MTLPMTIRRGRRGCARSASAGADNRDRCNLDRDGKGQRIGTERRTRVLARLAEHLREEIRCAVDDLRLVAELVGRENEASQLQHLLDVVETGGGFYLGEEVESTRARRV